MLWGDDCAKGLRVCGFDFLNREPPHKWLVNINPKIDVHHVQNPIETHAHTRNPDTVESREQLLTFSLAPLKISRWIHPAVSGCFKEINK